MRVSSLARYAALSTAIAAISGVLAWTAAAPARGENNDFLRDGHAGFVVANFAFALSDSPASETGVCPNGLSRGYANQGDPFPGRPDFQRGAEEIDADWVRRVWRVAISDDSIANVCKNPEVTAPDPNFQTITRRNVTALGIDLDGQDSRGGAGTCGHTDLRGPHGERGIDNQWYRVVGCGAGFQPGGMANNFDTEMYTGAWGLLITLSGVDDVRNDGDVELTIAASGDPIQLGPSRTPLPDATYAMHQNNRYRASVRGRIVNGVLTTERFDFNFITVIGDMFVERPMRDSLIQANLTADGSLDGFLGGYTPVEAMYDAQYGFRNGFYRNGEPARVFNRVSASVGQRFQYQDTCEGAYHAIHALADGHPDPQTGRCTTISNQYRFRAMRAFVVDEASESLNEELSDAAN